MSASRKWAIVTGASSGIGRALAREFAAGDFNVLLTGRNEPALQELAGQCATGFDVQTRVVPADLAQPEAVDALIDAISAFAADYEILVNNAGFGLHGAFAQAGGDQELQMLNVQLAATLKLTKAVLPSMVSRGSGRILNVASVYSFAPVPFQAVYSACKAFLLSFSSALQSELRGTGVTVTVFCPGITQTEFRSRASIAEKRKDSGISAEAAARIAYVATLQRKHIVVPGFLNRLFVLAARLIPGQAFANMVRFINRQRGQQ